MPTPSSESMARAREIVGEIAHHIEQQVERDWLAVTIARALDEARADALACLLDRLGAQPPPDRPTTEDDVYEHVCWLEGHAAARATEVTEVKRGDPSVCYEYCPHCDGCGWVEGGKAIKTECDHCDGRGCVHGDDCPTLADAGKV